MQRTSNGSSTLASSRRRQKVDSDRRQHFVAVDFDASVDDT